MGTKLIIFKIDTITDKFNEYFDLKLIEKTRTHFRYKRLNLYQTSEENNIDGWINLQRILFILGSTRLIGHIIFLQMLTRTLYKGNILSSHKKYL